MKLMKCKNYESKNTGGSRQYSYNVNPRQNKTRCGPERKKVCNKGSRNVTLIVIDISFGREQRHLDLDLETRTADTVATLRTGHSLVQGVGSLAIQWPLQSCVGSLKNTCKIRLTQMIL